MCKLCLRLYTSETPIWRSQIGGRELCGIRRLTFCAYVPCTRMNMSSHQFAADGLRKCVVCDSVCVQNTAWCAVLLVCWCACVKSQSPLDQTSKELPWVASANLLSVRPWRHQLRLVLQFCLLLQLLLQFCLLALFQPAISCALSQEGT